MRIVRMWTSVVWGCTIVITRRFARTLMGRSVVIVAAVLLGTVALLAFALVITLAYTACVKENPIIRADVIWGGPEMIAP